MLIYSKTIRSNKGGVASTSPTSQAGGPHIGSCSRLLIRYIPILLPYRRPIHLPYPEDAPCFCKGETIITYEITNNIINNNSNIIIY